LSVHPIPTIRPLQAADAPGYRAVMLDAYALHPDAFTSSVTERAALPMSWWEKRVSSASERVFGAFDDGALCGVAGLSIETRDKTRHKGTLFGMYVPAARRGQGIGEALVHAVLDEARACGLLAVGLTVTHGNAGAGALYRRCGFSAWGIEPMAMRHEGAFFAKVHMQCTL
jgi:ribosomal protein S18 acetylase RimI-like enzyme